MRRPLFIEAQLTPKDAEGKQWEVTIIGAETADDVITVAGESFVRSKNGRLYNVKALEQSVMRWDGVQVYDNHLTDAQYQASQGMRSQAREWLGNIIEPYFESNPLPKLKGTLLIVDEQLAGKLKNAWGMKILGRNGKGNTGLSIDTIPVVTREIMYANTSYPVVDDFSEILSVDLVGNPAAGGSFDRLIAAQTVPMTQEKIMNEEEIKALVAEQVQAGLATLPEIVKTALSEALQTEEETAPETETVPADPQADATAQAAQAALTEARLAKSELLLERKLTAAKLTPALEKTARLAFAGRVFDEKELDTMLSTLKEAQTTTDPTGRVKGAGGHISVFDEKDKAGLMLMHKLMDMSTFRGLEGHADDRVQDRVRESTALDAYFKNKTNLEYGGRVSELIRTAFLGGHWSLDDVRFEEALNLATVIKNTVNIMTAVDYSGQNRWYEGLVDEIESDNPIDDFTLARLFGATSLSVVDKGQPYTEMTFDDEEEVPTHVKKGNYVAVYLEDLMADKINYFRTIPTRLADAWYDTISAMAAAVFTTNSAAGPVMSDGGALFNSTAVTTVGGHANLLTTALSWTAYDAAITAMYNQTSRPLGTGRKLSDMGPFTLLVPNALRATANAIRNSEFVPSTSAAASQKNEYGPDGNQPTVQVVPDWTDATDWAIMARYRGKSPIKLIVPRGARTPQIFTADNELVGSMFTNDTIRYKLRMMLYHFSATYDTLPVSDWRLAHKSNVAG